MRWAAIVAAIVTGVLATAAGGTPLPPKSQGSGAEPTAGGGVIGGAPIRPRYALVEYASPGSDVYLYLSPKRIACGMLSYSQAPYIWVIVHTKGAPAVGKPTVTKGEDIVQVNFTFKDHYISATPGVTLVFTRIDPSKNGLWHGRLAVKKLTQKGKAYSYAGTFAARWCGSA